MKNYAVLVVFGASVAAVACGGSSGDPAQVVDPSVANTSTPDLKRATIDNMLLSFDDAASGASSVANQNAATLGVSTGEATAEFDSDARNFLNSTLALNDEAGATTVRNGNIITIDPDEQEICAEEVAGAGSDPADFSSCVALLKELTARIVATDEDAGVLTYLFAGNPLLSIGYAPMNGSFELNYGTLKSFLQAGINLDPESDLVLPDTLTGAMKISAATTNAGIGSEAGSLAYEVTQPINISDASTGTSVSIGTGKIFGMDVDAGTGSGSMEFDMGAFQANAPVRESSMGRISLTGFTGKASVSSQTGKLVVSNLGINRGPLSVSIDSVDILRMTMETLGFEVDEAGQNVVINGDLDFDLMIDDGALADSDALTNAMRTLQIAAPAGTGFFDTDGQLKVTQGGPLSVSIEILSSTGLQTGSATVAAGQCLASDDSVGLAAVECQSM